MAEITPITFAKPLIVPGRASVDVSFGPWVSAEEYLLWLDDELGAEPKVGTTIGIKTNIVSETQYSVVEYWNPDEATTFVPKGGGSSISLDTTVPASAEAASNTKAYSSKLSFTEIAKKQNALTQGYGIAIDADSKISVDSSKQVELVIVTDDGTEENLKLFSFE